jgi:hypothetical protein
MHLGTEGRATLVVFQLHENFVATYFNLVGQRSLGGGHAHCIPGPQIELRTVPGADQAVADQLAVAERAAIVRADVLTNMAKTTNRSLTSQGNGTFGFNSLSLQA